jgi:hypothetical protein
VVLVKAKVSIDPTVETGTLTLVIVNVPLAPVKRPVPPVIVLTVVTVAVPVDEMVPVAEPVENNSSPFAATVVPAPVMLSVFGPVRVIV